MALATQCPHCHTTFRVASDQLKLRGGIVRCGACQRIFDGNAHLIDLEAAAAAKKASEAPVPDTPEPEPEPEAAALASEPAADFETQPVYTLDFDHTFDPFGILPKAEPTLDADAPAVAPAAAQECIEPRFDVVADEDRAEQPAEDAGAEAAVQDAAADVPAHDEADAGAVVDAPAPESDPEPEPAPEPAAEPSPEPESEPAPAYAYAPAGRIEPTFDLPVDEALVAQPLRGHEPDLEPAFAPDPAAQQPSHAVPDDEQHAAAQPDRRTDGDGDADAAINDNAAPLAALPLRASSDLDAPYPPVDAAHDATAPKSARAKALDARARRSKLTPTRIEAPRLRVPASAESDEPEFVKRSRRQERSGKTVRILMAAGALVLLLLLAAQLLVAYRSELALRQPALNPLLSGLCAAAGCRVGLPAKAENLIIDDGELAPIGTDTYSLNTTLRNQGSLVQAWPSIELELTDANNKPLLRRVFGPADYLQGGAAATGGFGAHSEQPVRLNFALADLKPSGYHTFVFYP